MYSAGTKCPQFGGVLFSQVSCSMLAACSMLFSMNLSTECHAIMQSFISFTGFEAQDYEISCIKDQGAPAQRSVPTRITRSSSTDMYGMSVIGRCETLGEAFAWTSFMCP